MSKTPFPPLDRRTLFVSHETPETLATVSAGIVETSSQASGTVLTIGDAVSDVVNTETVETPETPSETLADGSTESHSTSTETGNTETESTTETTIVPGETSIPATLSESTFVRFTFGASDLPAITFGSIVDGDFVPETVSLEWRKMYRVADAVKNAGLVEKTAAARIRAGLSESRKVEKTLKTETALIDGFKSYLKLTLGRDATPEELDAFLATLPSTSTDSTDSTDSTESTETPEASESTETPETESTESTTETESTEN